MKAQEETPLIPLTVGVVATVFSIGGMTYTGLAGDFNLTFIFAFSVVPSAAFTLYVLDYWNGGEQPTAETAP